MKQNELHRFAVTLRRMWPTVESCVTFINCCCQIAHVGMFIMWPATHTDDNILLACSCKPNLQCSCGRWPKSCCRGRRCRKRSARGC